MIKSAQVLAIILLTISNTHSRVNMEQQVTYDVDRVARSVVYLQVPKPGAAQNNSDIGTGFLVNLNGHIFLTTAAHVANLMTSKASVIFGKESDEMQSIPIADLLPGVGEPKWVKHQTADVATLYLQLKPSVSSILSARALPPALFVSKLEAPARARTLTVVGFPLGLGVVFPAAGGKISPITKESKASSGLLTLPQAGGNKLNDFFLLDSPSVGGFSGSPVFILPSAYSDNSGLVFSSSTFCVGLIHGTISDDTGGKFAAVVPSAFITQTLEVAYSAAVQK